MKTSKDIPVAHDRIRIPAMYISPEDAEVLTRALAAFGLDESKLGTELRAGLDVIRGQSALRQRTLAMPSISEALKAAKTEAVELIRTMIQALYRDRSETTRFFAPSRGNGCFCEVAIMANVAAIAAGGHPVLIFTIHHTNYRFGYCVGGSDRLTGEDAAELRSIVDQALVSILDVSVRDVWNGAGVDSMSFGLYPVAPEKPKRMPSTEPTTQDDEE